MDLTQISNLVVREVANMTAPTTLACEVGNNFNGRIGARVSSIFVIFIGSTLGMFRLLCAALYVAYAGQVRAFPSSCAGGPRTTDSWNMPSSSPNTLAAASSSRRPSST
jgi:hypothetical protein